MKAACWEEKRKVAVQGRCLIRPWSIPTTSS